MPKTDKWVETEIVLLLFLKGEGHSGAAGGVAIQERVRAVGYEQAQHSNELHRFRDPETERFVN